MNITKDEPYTVHYHTRTIDFEGATPILLRRNYSHGGKEFLPDHAFAKWQHGEAITDIHVSGHVLKQDGTPGMSRATLDYATPAGKGWDSPHHVNAPEWLLALFADSPHTTPEGA